MTSRCNNDPSRVLLVVEDEPLVSMVMGEALAEAGLNVLQAFNASEALSFLEARPDLLGVFCDINLPGEANGISFAWEVKTRWPNTPVTLLSARSRPTKEMLPEDVVFVPKPCSMDVLIDHALRMVHHTLSLAQEDDESMVASFECRSDHA